MERDIFTAGPYTVREWYREACKSCRTGWDNGTIVHPQAEGGVECTHGPGCWQVGTVGPRGGFRAITDRYTSQRAARHVCQALYEASRFPPD